MTPRRRSGKKPAALGNYRGRSSGKSNSRAPGAQTPAERQSSPRVASKATPAAAGQESRRISSNTVTTPRGSPPSDTCSLPVRSQGSGPSDAPHSRSGKRQRGIESSPSEEFSLLFGDGDQGEEDEHPERKRAKRRLFELHGREPEEDFDDIVHASAADMDRVAQSQVVGDVIVLTRRESVAGSLPSQPRGSHFSREFDEDSNHGVLRVMGELHARLEKQLAIEKREILGAIKAVSSRVSTLERTLSRCQDALNMFLLSSALPKTGMAAEKASLIDLLSPM